MCTEGEHKTHKLLDDIKTIIDGRPPLGQIYALSATQAYELDYKERKHIFVWPLSTFTLTLEEYGNLAITAQTWTELPFPPGLRIFASGQTIPVQMFVLCTDEEIDPTSAGGGGGGGGAVTVADGADVAEGASTDAAVVGDNSGTVSAKLRGLSKIFNDVWDSVNHRIKVDGSSVTQPVSGTVTANAGTNLNTSLLALETGGNLATLAGAVSSSKVQTQQQVASSGGAIPYHNITGASTNFTNVKAAATQCYGVDISNTSVSTIFVKLYDKATTPGTGDTPKRTIQVPANSTVCRAYPEGLKFTTGFGWAATGAVADNDNTNIAANCVVDYNLAT